MATTEPISGSGEVGPRNGAAWPVFLMIIPAAWIVVALVHPSGTGDVYESLADEVPLWLGVHFAQLFLAVGLALIFLAAARGP